MAAHRVFCNLDTLSEVIRLRKDHPYSSVYSVIDKLSDIYLDCESKSDFEQLATLNPVINKLRKRENRHVYYQPQWRQAIKKPLADDIFLLQLSSSDPIRGFRTRRGVLLTESLTDLQIIDDLATNHYRPYNLLTDEQKKRLQKHNEEFEDISSWKDVLSTVNVAPIDSAIIIDNYLFSNYDKRKPSLVSIIKSLVPKGLAIPFHLTIFIYNRNGALNKKMMEQAISEIHALKLSSSIKVSIVAHNSGDVTHDRKILTNYHLITSGKGFAVMDNRGIKENAQGEVISTFHNINNITSFTSVKQIHSQILVWTKDIYRDLKKGTSIYAFEVGDDFKNRLLAE